MKIAYVFTDVPHVPGQFPNAELDAMRERGIPIEIFVLRNRPARSEEALRLERTFVVHRSPYLFSRRLLSDLIRAKFGRPVLFVRTFASVFRESLASPRVLIRSLAVLPKSIHFAAEVERRGITQIHAYWAHLPALSASVMARFSGRGFTTWAHAGGDIYQRTFQTERALRSRLEEARLVLTCNRANLDYFRDLVSPSVLARIHLLTHGVDLEQFHGRVVPRDWEVPRILTVGGLTPAKGHRVLLDACRILRERGRVFECWIAGGGPLERWLREYARERGVEEAVRFLGHVDHGRLPDLYRQADLFVMPSIRGPAGARDGLPNVLLEAMSCGLPSVGSDFASIPEVIRHEETGLLTPPGDAPALASAIERLLDDGELRGRLGRQAADLVRVGFSRPTAMDRLAELFRSLHQKENGGRE